MALNALMTFKQALEAVLTESIKAKLSIKILCQKF
jgi:hypothetical protein